MNITVYGYDHAREAITNTVREEVFNILVDLEFIPQDAEITLEFKSAEVKFRKNDPTEVVTAPALELPEKFFYEKQLMRTLSEAYPMVLIHAAGGYAHYGGKQVKIITE